MNTFTFDTSTLFPFHLSECRTLAHLQHCKLEKVCVVHHWTNRLPWYIVALILSWQPRPTCQKADPDSWCNAVQRPSSPSVFHFNHFSSITQRLGVSTASRSVAPGPIDRLVGYDWLGALLLLSLRFSRISKETFVKVEYIPLLTLVSTINRESTHWA